MNPFECYPLESDCQFAMFQLKLLLNFRLVHDICITYGLPRVFTPYLIPFGCYPLESELLLDVIPMSQNCFWMLSP
jgi:hypothetical protein